MAGAGMSKHHWVHREPRLEAQAGDQRQCLGPVRDRGGHGPGGRQVHAGRVDGRDPLPGPHAGAYPSQPRVPRRGPTARQGRHRSVRDAQSCAVTSSWCSWTALTWRPPALSSTPAASTRTKSEASISSWTIMSRRRCRENWERLMIRRLPLEIRECRDRRLGRAAVELVSHDAGRRRHRGLGTTTSAFVLMGLGPPAARPYRRPPSGLVGRLPHANATVVPFQLGKTDREVRPAVKHVPNPAGQGPRPKKRAREVERSEEPVLVEGSSLSARSSGVRRQGSPGELPRSKCNPGGGPRCLSCTLADRSGSVTLVFTRRDVPGVETGAQFVAEGTVGEHEGRLAMLNPLHEVLKRAPTDPIRRLTGPAVAAQPAGGAGGDGDRPLALPLQ